MAGGVRRHGVLAGRREHMERDLIDVEMPNECVSRCALPIRNDSNEHYGLFTAKLTRCLALSVSEKWLNAIMTAHAMLIMDVATCSTLKMVHAPCASAR